jgi:hypothetical protein
VLYGARDLLKTRRIKNLYFEQNKERMGELGITTGEAAAFLRECGYDVQPLNDPASSLVEYYARPTS